MTTITDELNVGADYARGAKEDRVANGRTPDEQTLRHTLVCHRGDETAAVVFFTGDNSRELLLLGNLCARGYAPDYMTLVVDAYGTVPTPQWDGSTNPITGERWAPGEMQDLVLNHGAMERGWLREILDVLVVNRAGDVGHRILGYTIEGDKVVWAEPKDVDRNGGLLPEGLQRAMVEVPTVDQTMAQLGVTPATAGLTVEEARAHLDIVVTRTIVQSGLGAVLLQGGDGYRSDAIRGAFPGGRDITPGAETEPGR